VVSLVNTIARARAKEVVEALRAVPPPTAVAVAPADPAPDEDQDPDEPEEQMS
jgi:hypothetical protein